MRNRPKLHIEDTWSFEPWPNVQKRLQAQIAAYKAEIEKYSAKIAFDAARMPETRAHHQWLALYQCKRMSAAQILDWERKHNNRKLDVSAVRHGVSTTPCAKVKTHIGMVIARRQRYGRPQI